MQSPSYDPQMEKMPVFISYPRSGSNWLNCMMELYFDRPRLRAGPITFLKNKNNRNDYMWFHDHDETSKLKISHDQILYLYRDPCYVIFSILNAKNKIINNKSVSDEINLLKQHHEKYIATNLSKTIIKYENLKSNLENEFRKILVFFNVKEDPDTERLNYANNIVTLNSIVDKAIDKRFFNNKMNTKQYGECREKFIETYGEKIKKSLPRAYE